MMLRISMKDETARIIQQGRYRDAMTRKIRDVRCVANNVSGDRRKYNEAIRKMFHCARHSD
jgi:hypothetical protein